MNFVIEDLAPYIGVSLLCFLLYKIIFSSTTKPSSEEAKTNTNSNSDYYNFCTNPNCLRCSSNGQNEHLKFKPEDFYHLPRLRKWSESAHKMLGNKKQKPTVFYLPGLGAHPVIDSSLYREDVSTLESNCDVIIRELDNLLQKKTESDGWKTNSTPTGQWNTFYLFNQGSQIYENTAQCPETTKLLASLPNFMRNCAFGNACFSVLDSKTSISEHYGPCNIRLRCHLGLYVSKNWSLNVDNRVVTWKEKECLLFDDSFLHSVSFNNNNKSNVQSRVILLVDLWHYNLDKNEKSSICELFPPR